MARSSAQSGARRTLVARTLRRAFYARPAPVVARALLGCVLVSRRGGAVTSGRIVETEAYLGPEDAASHAAFRPGSRALFYGPGGVAYVFRAYGLHDCLNTIAGPIGHPGCVLIRALEPRQGIDVMARRRGVPPTSSRLATGPGNLTRALGITRGDTGRDMTAGPLVIQPGDAGGTMRIARGPRVGITRSAERVLRFWIAGNRWVSRGP